MKSMLEIKSCPSKIQRSGDLNPKIRRISSDHYAAQDSSQLLECQNIHILYLPLLLLFHFLPGDPSVQESPKRVSVPNKLAEACTSTNGEVIMRMSWKILIARLSGYQAESSGSSPVRDFLSQLLE